MRVLPFGSETAAKEKRLRFSWKIGVQPPAPPVVERMRPPVLRFASAAYTVFGSPGSNLTSLTEPLSVCVNEAPPSVELYTPGAAVAGAVRLVEFEASPRVPERVLKRRCCGLPGWTATHVIDRRFAAANEPGTRDQCEPPSVVL